MTKTDFKIKKLAFIGAVMKKVVVFLVIMLVLLSVVSGYFFFENRNLNDQINGLRSEVGEYQIQMNQYETQTTELENRIDELENPVYDVKITSLSVIENINTPVGVALFFDTYITIRNNGNTAVTGLTIFLKRIGEGGTYGDYLLGEGYALLDTIQPGEEQEIRAQIETNLGLAWKVKPITHLATLRLGTLIVDEYTLS